MDRFKFLGITEFYSGKFKAYITAIFSHKSFFNLQLQLTDLNRVNKTQSIIISEGNSNRAVLKRPSKLTPPVAFMEIPNSLNS